MVSKDDLLRDVWEDEYINEGTIAVHIRHLREKIEKDPNAPDIIKTIWGVGYIIEKTEEKGQNEELQQDIAASGGSNARRSGSFCRDNQFIPQP